MDELLAADARQLAKMISLSLRTIRQMDAAGKLPRPLRVGKRVLWRVDEIRKWLDAGCPSRKDWESLKKAKR